MNAPTHPFFALALSLPFLVGPATALAEPPGPIDFDRDVRPILADKCFTCHGPDAAVRKAGVRLDRREDVLAVASPGDPAASELFRRISAESKDEVMPPSEMDDALSADEIATIRRWIDAGLPWKEHWAFQTPRRPRTPETSRYSTSSNPIDAFVHQALDKRTGRTVPLKDPADPAKLMRRVSFDLTGVPPTLETLDAFLTDNRPDAYKRVVDRLLASPRYGEHMAQWWLDGARYADTNGYQNDFARHQWPWRDWVIAAFNQNMPYDQFALEQIAGDLLPNATLSQRVATGFNRNHRTVTEVGSIDEEWRVENVVDRVETTATVFLGLTMGCARCHDHKYDPISQRDFFRFYAFFNSVAEKGVYSETRGNVPPLVTVPRSSDEAAIAAIDLALEKARVEADDRKAEIPDLLESWKAQLRSQTTAAPRDATLRLTTGAPFGDSAPSRSVAPHISLAGQKGSYADLGQSVLLDDEEPFSIALWVLPEKNGAVLSKMADDDTYRGVDLLVEPGRTLVVHLIHDWPENAIKVESEQTLRLGEWAHVVVRYDGSRKATGVQIHIDGAEAALKVHSDTLQGTLHTAAPLRLGRRHYAPYFGGAIADLRLFNRTLREEERAAIRTDRLRTVLSLADSEENGARDLATTQELNALLMKVYGSALQVALGRIDTLERQREEQLRSTPTAMVMGDLEEPRPTYLLSRGRYDAPVGDPLEPGLPDVLPPFPEDAPRNRLGLAQWMIAEDNPLTARVVVNQLWQRFFGVGLVDTAENFGVQGARPSHPALLDWLATELIRLDWDLKALQRQIVSSATYRQRSHATGAEYAADPNNRLLARGPRFRLSAEALRDQGLLVSGLLVEQIGGPPTRPYQPPGLWKELAGGAGQGPYVQDSGDGLYRRSLYTHRKRTVPHPTLSTFDASGFEICQVRRSRTNTPLQALAVLNDITFVEAARRLAERMMTEGGETPRDRITFAFRALTSRTPTTSELDVLARGFESRRLRLVQSPLDAADLIQIGDSEPDPSLDPPTLAAYSLTASVIMNLDESLTKE